MSTFLTLLQYLPALIKFGIESVEAIEGLVRQISSDATLSDEQKAALIARIRVDLQLEALRVQAVPVPPRSA